MAFHGARYLAKSLSNAAHFIHAHREMSHCPFTDEGTGAPRGKQAATQCLPVDLSVTPQWLRVPREGCQVTSSPLSGPSE